MTFKIGISSVTDWLIIFFSWGLTRGIKWSFWAPFVFYLQCPFKLTLRWNYPKEQLNEQNRWNYRKEQPNEQSKCKKFVTSIFFIVYQDFFCKIWILELFPSGMVLKTKYLSVPFFYGLNGVCGNQFVILFKLPSKPCKHFNSSI